MHKKNIGLLGGSFNPITQAHIQLAQFVIAEAQLDEVWILPCYNHCLKNFLVDSFNRVEMCKMACQDTLNIKVSAYEIEHDLDGSVFNLMNCLNEDAKMADYDFSFIIGTDNVLIFDSWKNAEALKKIVKFITVPRQGVTVPKDIVWYKKSPHIYLDKKDPIANISSTEIRKLLNERRKGLLSIEQIMDFEDKINRSVLSYIEKYHLYKDAKQ